VPGAASLLSSFFLVKYTQADLAPHICLPRAEGFQPCALEGRNSGAGSGRAVLPGMLNLPR